MEDFNYSVSDMPCKKHPNISSVGICPHCLKDRLIKLVCSDCGEQRLSSCSCSDVSSSYRNSCSTMEIGSVGRVSFLLENEKIENQLINQVNSSTKRKNDEEQVVYFKRSNSSCVEVKKNSNGFWKIKRLFRKKVRNGKKDEVFTDEKSDVWVSDIMGVSRSRSLCSFGNGGTNNDDFGSSSAKISDVTSGIFFNESSEPRKSGFKNVFDSSKRSSVDKSVFKNLFDSKRSSVDRSYSVGRMNVFPSRESDFSGMDESAFIDLKLDSESLEARQEFVNGRRSAASDHGGFKSDNFENLACLRSNVDDDCCRNNANVKGLRRSKSHKVWKWIFGYNPVSKEKITS